MASASTSPRSGTSPAVANRQVRLMMRSWAGNDPLKLSVLVAVLVDHKSVRWCEEVIGGPRKVVSKSQAARWVAEFREVARSALEQEGVELWEVMEG